ncbi:MAG: hypothetical protein R3A52_13565 [Polyangiales bacterium]
MLRRQMRMTLGGLGSDRRCTPAMACAAWPTPFGALAAALGAA